MEQVKEAKEVARFDNRIVQNNAMKFDKKLTINQQKMLYYLIIREKNGDSLQGAKWSELQEIIGIRNSTLNDRKSFLEDIRSVSVSMCVDKENMEFHYIFPSIGIRFNKLYYTINPEISTLFDKPTIKYYLVNFKMIRYFKHDNSILIYQLLNKELSANDTKKHNFTYDINFLKEYLGLENTKAYDDFSNFRRVILEPSLKEINEHSDIQIEGEFNTRTKKYQLLSKVRRKDVVFIGGISRKTISQEYPPDKCDGEVTEPNKGKTKVNTKTFEKNEQTDLGIDIPTNLVKDKYGKFGHVKLSKDQYSEALDEFGNLEELDKVIEILDEYFEQIPGASEKYNNHLISLKNFAKSILDKRKMKDDNKYSTHVSYESKYIPPTYDKFVGQEICPEEALTILDDLFISKEESTKKDVTLVEEVAVLTNESPHKSFDEEVLTEKLIVKKINSNIPNDLSAAVINLYFWYFEGVITKKDASAQLKGFEKKFDYKLSGEEKHKLYHTAKDSWDERLPF